MKPLLPETGVLDRVEGGSAVIAIKCGGFAGVQQIHMPIA